MAKTNWLKNLLVKEMSLVDRPANPGAVAVLAKRDEPVEKDMYGVSRFADLISSLGYLLRSSEYEAKEEGDNSQVPAALRSWLKQGVPIFQAMATEEINELLAVSTAKRDGQPTAKFVALTKALDHANGALSESIKSILGDDAVTDKDAAIDQTIKQFSEHVEGELEKSLSGDGPGNPSGDDDMDKIKKALGLADTASEADVLAAIAKRDADAEILKASMSDDEKSHHDALKSDDDKKAFRGMSRDQRKAKMTKRDDDLPPHIKKALDDAEELRKRMAVLEAKDELVTFQKRATEIGLTEAQGELLQKAHKGDKDALKSIENCIKGLNEQIATGKIFSEFGSSQGGNADDPYAEITAKAEVLRKAEPKLTIEKAKARVIEDPANAELIKRYNTEQRRKLNAA
jgi:hypothetical protein